MQEYVGLLAISGCRAASSAAAASAAACACALARSSNLAALAAAASSASYNEHAGGLAMYVQCQRRRSLIEDWIGIRFGRGLGLGWGSVQYRKQNYATLIVYSWYIAHRSSSNYTIQCCAGYSGWVSGGGWEFWIRDTIDTYIYTDIYIDSKYRLWVIWFLLLFFNR